MTTNSKTNKATHVIVGIGASAGGLQALNDFFDNVPTASLYSYIVVQHLSPDHKSLMAELLRKNTKIPTDTQLSEAIPSTFRAPPCPKLRICSSTYEEMCFSNTKSYLDR